MFTKKLQLTVLCFYLMFGFAFGELASSEDLESCMGMCLDDPAVRIIKSCETTRYIPGHAYEELVRIEDCEVDTGLRIDGARVTRVEKRKITQTKHTEGRFVEEKTDCCLGASIACFIFRLNQIAGAAIPIHKLLNSDENLGNVTTAAWVGAGLTIGSTVLRSLKSWKDGCCDSDYPRLIGFCNRSLDYINTFCFITAAALLGTQNDQGSIDSHVRNVSTGLLITSAVLSSLDAVKSCCSLWLYN